MSDPFLHFTQCSGSSTNTVVDEDWKSWLRPVCYKYQCSIDPTITKLPFPDIIDNTEGIAAMHDLPLAKLVRENPRLLLADIGCGRSDAAKLWLENQFPTQLEVVTVDPYARTHEHNCAAFERISAANGADIVTSMSVVNVIPTIEERSSHYTTVHSTLTLGGTAFFKIWAGFWPERGTGKHSRCSNEGVYQANAWASSFVDEVETIFGHGNVFADNNANLIVAIKTSFR